MSGGALRQVFLELGFDIDFAALEKLDADIRTLAGALEGEAKKAEASAKSTAAAAKTAADAAKKAAEEAANAKKKAAEVAKTGTKEEAAAAKKFADEKEAAAKAAAEAAKKAAEAAKLAGDAAKAAGKAASDASKEAADKTKELADAQKLAKTAMAATAAAALTMGAHFAMAFGREFAGAAETLRDVAIESRVTTTELQGLDHAAVQAGVGAERMRSAVSTFGQSLRSAERWGNGTTSTLRRLGIQSRDSAGHIRPTADLLDEVAVGLERVENPYRRVRVAQQLFGESGRRMLEVLHTGPGGIRQLREELEELGGGVTPEAIEASRRFTQAQERQGRAMDSLRSVLATSLLPALSWWLNLVAKGEGALARLTRGTHVTEIALAALGAAGVYAAGTVLAAWLPAAAPFIVAGLAAAAFVLVMDDVITFVEGGDSALGRIIDSLFEVGTAARWSENLRGTWQGFKIILDDVGAVLDTIVAKFDELREAAAPVLSRVNSFVDAVGLGGVSGAQVGSGDAGAAFASAGFRTAVGRPAKGRAGRIAATQAVADVAPQAMQVVPAASGMMTVQASGTAGRERVSKVTHINNTHGPIHVHGITDPQRAADEVGRILEQRAREQRDADHPTEDDD